MSGFLHIAWVAAVAAACRATVPTPQAVIPATERGAVPVTPTPEDQERAFRLVDSAQAAARAFDVERAQAHSRDVAQYPETVAFSHSKLARRRIDASGGPFAGWDGVEWILGRPADLPTTLVAFETHYDPRAFRELHALHTELGARGLQVVLVYGARFHASSERQRMEARLGRARTGVIVGVGVPLWEAHDVPTLGTRLLVHDGVVLWRGQGAVPREGLEKVLSPR